MSGNQPGSARGRTTKSSASTSKQPAKALTVRTAVESPSGRSSASGGYRLRAHGPLKAGGQGKTLSSVTGRFINKPQARSTASAPPAPGGPASKPPSVRDQTVRNKGAAFSNPHRRDAKVNAKKETVDKAELAAALEVVTGTGKTETLSLTVEMREYLDELRTQLESLVLPSVLARIAKGAAAIAPADLARRMLAVAPVPAPVNRMAEQVGPEFYDTNGVATILAGAGNSPLSKQAIEQRRRRRTIVALPTAEGRWIYPTWQFDDNDVLPGLGDVLTAFQTMATTAAAGRSKTRAAPFDEWSIGTWLTTPRDDLDGDTAVGWLRECRHEQCLDRLLTVVRRTAAAWAA